MITLLTGLAAGSAHVVSGPDHLAALAPLAMHRPARAMRTGAFWGLGHGVGVLIVAGIGQALRGLINIDAISAWSELLVGVLLIGIGLWAFRSSSRLVIHQHPHGHGDAEGDPGAQGHVHRHLHTNLTEHDAPEAHSSHSHASFWIGTLHGAAGTGHLLGVLPSLAMPPAQAAVYLGGYFVAAVGSMALFGLAMGSVARRGGRRAIRGLMIASSTAAVIIGCIWVGLALPVVA